MNGTRTIFHIAIVGAGAYGTAVLDQLALNKIPNGPRRLCIFVVEWAKELGPGMPYSKRMTIPDHKLNIARGCTQIAATYIPVSKKTDFQLLYLRSITPGRRIRMGVEKYENEKWLHHSFPRFIVGLCLSDRFSQFV